MKKLVIITSISLIALWVIVYQAHTASNTESISINIAGQPTLGKKGAKVSVLVFEEPKCINCKIFNKSIFPSIKHDYIDTGKVRYTLVPVSFIQGSLESAEALLCIYHQNRTANAELFFAFFEELFEHQEKELEDWTAYPKLIQFARKTPGVDVKKLESCLAADRQRAQIMKNNDLGRKLMGGTLRTPSVYVNGTHIKEITYSNIKSAIAKEIKNDAK